MHSTPFVLNTMILFYLILLLTFLYMIYSRKIIRTLLALICIYISSFPLLINVHVDFFAAIVILLYVGAISVFFTFVIMTLPIIEKPAPERKRGRENALLRNSDSFPGRQASKDSSIDTLGGVTALCPGRPQANTKGRLILRGQSPRNIGNEDFQYTTPSFNSGSSSDNFIHKWAFGESFFSFMLIPLVSFLSIKHFDMFSLVNMASSNEFFPTIFKMASPSSLYFLMDNIHLIGYALFFYNVFEFFTLAILLLGATVGAMMYTMRPLAATDSAGSKSHQ